MPLKITRKAGECVCIGPQPYRLSVVQTGARGENDRPTATLALVDGDAVEVGRFTVTPGETLTLGVEIGNDEMPLHIEFERCSPSRCILLFDGPREIDIWRAEILTRRMARPAPVTATAMAGLRSPVLA